MSYQAQRRPLANRSPIFYGWVVWIVATFGIIATAPGQSFTVSLFFDFFIDEFELSRSTVSTLYGVGTFLASLSLTWIGQAIDRFGNRLMGVLISAAFATVLVLWSFVAGPVPLLLGFIAIRGLGQGSLSLVSSTAVAEWFHRYRGRLLSLSFVAFGLFQRWYVPALNDLLHRYDWRQVWIMLGAGVGLTIPLLMWVFIRNRPEDYGLQPDGIAPPVTASTGASPLSTDDNSWTLNEALRTAMLWVFVTGRMLTPAWITGLVIHQVSIFEELGHTGDTAADTYGNLALFSAGFALAGGYLVDRLRPGVALALQLAALAAACGMATTMTASWHLIIYAVLAAAAMGSGSSFDGAVWPNLFGRRHQGSIRGFVTTTLVSGTAIGPILFGLSYDLLGGYTPVLVTGMVLSAIALVAGLLVPEPTRRTPTALPPA